jgi:hypothetical protein
MTPSISAWNAPCGASIPITMTWTFVGTPGPQILIDLSNPTEIEPGFNQWFAPGEFGADLPATTDSGQTTSQVSGVIDVSLSHDLSNGPHSLQIATISPVALTAQATVMKNC